MKKIVSEKIDDIRDLYRKALSNTIPAMDEIEGDGAKPENNGENTGETLKTQDKTPDTS